MATPRSLVTLPTEVLEAIFLQLDVQSLVAVGQTCHLLKTTAEAPVIWRQLCLTSFRVWAPHHNIAAKTNAPLSSVDWRSLFIHRIKIANWTRTRLNKALESQHRRSQHINEVAEFGIDAKEILEKEAACPDDAEDVLARRYYAKAILGRIQREVAIKMWKELGEGKPVPIERALGGYDLFTRSDEDADLDVIAGQLDRLAEQLLIKHPDFHELSTRWKALTLASFLRDQGFRGVSQGSYRAVQNCFIGLVLGSPEHESLPLINVAIYCALARRVGVDARPCGFLYHMYCLVYAPENRDLDGKYQPNSPEDRRCMYLDPYTSAEEVAKTTLQTQLRDMGVASSDQEEYLTHADTRRTTLRMQRNIITSVQTLRQPANLRPNWRRTDRPDLNDAFYSAIWSFLMLLPREEEPGHFEDLHSPNSRRRQYLPYLLEHLQNYYPYDSSLLERYVIPFFAGQPEAERLSAFVHSMDTIDNARKDVHRRAPSTNKKVAFKVGQLFKHKRYDYEGVIVGWDVACGAGEDWIADMGVDRLPHGRTQSFYHVLVADKTTRYVAEENIEPIDFSAYSDTTAGPSSSQSPSSSSTPESQSPSPSTQTTPPYPSQALLAIAGRHFKRWDSINHIFVSNVRDEYPDD